MIVHLQVCLTVAFASYYLLETQRITHIHNSSSSSYASTPADPFQLQLQLPPVHRRRLRSVVRARRDFVVRKPGVGKLLGLNKPVRTECGTQDCNNKGTCWKDVTAANGFVCNCTPGYYGRVCDITLPDCESNPCRNGATCVVVADGFKCECRGDFGGKKCEQKFGPVTIPPREKRAEEVGVYILGFCLLCFLLAGISFFYYHTRARLQRFNALKKDHAKFRTDPFSVCYFMFADLARTCVRVVFCFKTGKKSDEKLQTLRDFEQLHDDMYKDDDASGVDAWDPLQKMKTIAKQEATVMRKTMKGMDARQTTAGKDLMNVLGDVRELAAGRKRAEQKERLREAKEKLASFKGDGTTEFDEDDPEDRVLLKRAMNWGFKTLDGTAASDGRAAAGASEKKTVTIAEPPATGF